MRLIYDREQGGSRDLSDADLVELYRYPAPTDRAYVRSNFVSSVDGSVQGPDGRAGSINTASDGRIFALHRALTDAVVVGASTVRQEGYRAVDLASWQRELRAAEGLAPFPTLIVISGSAEIDPSIGSAEGGEGGPVVVVTTPGKPESTLRPLREAGVEVRISDRTELDLGAVLDDLAGTGLSRLLCEGGPGLHRRMLADGLIDELSLTLAPVVVGGQGLRTTSGDAFEPVVDLELHFVLYADDDTLFTNYRRQPTSRPRLS